jgi:hypothetical protein
MENVFGEGFLTCGILLFYFSMMVLWSKSLSQRVSKRNRENEKDEENAVVGFLGLEVIIFLVLGGFLFMNYRKK